MLMIFPNTDKFSAKSNSVAIYKIRAAEKKYYLYEIELKQFLKGKSGAYKFDYCTLTSKLPQRQP